MAKFGVSVSPIILLVHFMVLSGVVRSQNVPAMFIFGDSLIDNGNNNNMASLAKANYFPYGIDFNGGPTGRFSNGYTIVDEIAELLGLPLIPAYNGATRNQVLHAGVNYASAAAGILDATGRNFVGRIPFDEQLRNFENTLNEITENLGADYMATELSRCIFFVGMGSNDYLNNYLMPNYNTRNQYNGQQYADLLVQTYNNQLTRLYNLGARKFVIA
ncbi:GDSL Lipase/Acylhydrolase superfamily protein [Trifolium repens]|nr:GDSL Lipase/Acylhydrolase superfamily protein [Trifolium repens]